jgi:hypothetical protein
MNKKTKKKVIKMKHVIQKFYYNYKRIINKTRTGKK